MRQHPRTETVTMARRDLEKTMIELMQRYELTYAEIFSLLGEQVSRTSMYAIRTERHPNNPDKRGDEE